MKIDMNKKYRRVGTHEPVRVICVDRKVSKIPCIGLYNTGTSEGVCYFNHEGYYGGTQVIEEILAVDWSKVVVDTPIWVRYNGVNWVRRHFSTFQNDKVYFWPDGTTSFTYDFPSAECYNVVVENASLENPNA